MTLRPDSAPARLLLRLSSEQASGEQSTKVLACYARTRLIELGYAKERACPLYLVLTPEGQKVANELRHRGPKGEGCGRDR